MKVATDSISGRQFAVKMLQVTLFEVVSCHRFPCRSRSGWNRIEVLYIKFTVLLQVPDILQERMLLNVKKEAANQKHNI